MIAKSLVKRNFSRFAGRYDGYSSVQQRAGQRLINGLGSEMFRQILDIGCGTGNYTLLLREKFPRADIKAVDFSSSMIEVAANKLAGQQIEFAVADAELMALNRRFDLITSNACFQWFGNLERAIENYKGAIENGGVVLFSIFGPKTFARLRDAISRLLKKEISISSNDFLDADGLTAILKKNFNNISVEEQIFEETYPSVRQLLSTIKYTGTQGAGIGGGRLTRGQIAELEKIYKDEFKIVSATYQVFYCRADCGG